jgi:hypothetical protein
MTKINTALGTLNKKKISTKDLNELRDYIKSASFDLVADYYGINIDQIDQKEKRKMKLKMQKIIERKICLQYKITHIKNLKWFDLIEVKMFIDDLSIHDIKIFL